MPDKELFSCDLKGVQGPLEVSVGKQTHTPTNLRQLDT